MTARPLIAMLFVGTVVSAQTPAPPVAMPAAAPQPSAATATCPEMATALNMLMARDMRMRDWAEMARYRDANKTLPAPAANDARVDVAIPAGGIPRKVRHRCNAWQPVRQTPTAP